MHVFDPAGRLQWRMTSVLIGSALVVLTINAFANAQASFVRYYQGQAVALDLDTSRIAVFIEADADGSDAVDALLPFGFLADNVQVQSVVGWSLADTPADIDTEQEIEDLIEQIAVAGDVDFVSPVFFDDVGEPAVITRELVVRLAPGVPREQLIAEIDPDGDGSEILAFDWAGMTGVFRVDSQTINGLDALAQANDLATNNLTAWAEIDWLLRAQTELIPNDPLFNQCWGLLNTGQDFGTCLGTNPPPGIPGMDMNAEEAWNIETGSAAIQVGIFDSGIQQNHPDINQNPGFDVTSAGPEIGRAHV